MSKNAGAQWWIPSENEWYKAAYNNGGSAATDYFLYPTGSNSPPGHGADIFHTKAFEAHGIPGIALADGPHGLRKQVAASDRLGVNKSVPATCFPTASLSACSWDRELLYEMGAAIGEEALQEGVAVVLGPGVNIKRNPLCGRNFEYFSEDPYLAGELAAAWIRGMQSRGVGASLKHFAGNNQENERMSSDSVIDERTLREIYLPAFESAVKRRQPCAP